MCKYKENLIEIINKCGEGQFDLLQEECAELIKAISKYKRMRCMETRENVIEEIADVLVIIDQIKILMGISKENVEKQIEFKINRTLDRLSKGKEL